MARFRFVEDVLDFAFRMEAKQVYAKMGNMEISTAGGENLLDRVADGLMIKNYCLQHLGLMTTHLVLAHYTVPVPELDKKKQEHTEILGHWIAGRTHRDRWMLTDGVREWIGEKPIHGTDWWGKKNGKTDRTIRNYWRSDDPSMRSVKYLLNQLNTQAMDMLVDPLREKELIP